MLAAVHTCELTVMAGGCALVDVLLKGSRKDAKWKSFEEEEAMEERMKRGGRSRGGQSQ